MATKLTTDQKAQLRMLRVKQGDIKILTSSGPEKPKSLPASQAFAPKASSQPS
jgi:hypothetical protein